jgi:hypothetical protein
MTARFCTVFAAVLSLLIVTAPAFADDEGDAAEARQQAIAARQEADRNRCINYGFQEGHRPAAACRADEEARSRRRGDNPGR